MAATITRTGTTLCLLKFKGGLENTYFTGPDSTDEKSLMTAVRSVVRNTWGADFRPVITSRLDSDGKWTFSITENEEDGALAGTIWALPS